MRANLKESSKYRWYVLATVAIGTFMSTLDGSIVNVALPTMSQQMHSDLTKLQWIVTAYLLTISSLLPVFGRISDLLGRKRIFSLGFLIFTLGSALCGTSQNIWFLVGMRILQALGASMLMSNSPAIITAIFPAKERGKALGLNGTVVALGSLTGPALGGILIGLVGWRSIFYINLPIGIIGYLAARFILPTDEPREQRERFDLTGALLFTIGMVCTLFAINNGEDWGWSSIPIIAGLVLGAALLVSFVILEFRVRSPLIDLTLFRRRPFLIGNITGYLSFVILFANTMLLPFYLQQVLNYSPTQVGLLMTVFPIVMAVAAPVSGNLSDKFGPMVLTTGGLAILGVGMFYYSTLPATASFWQVIPGPILAGLGSGMFQSPNNSSVMSSVPRSELSVAGGINSTLRNVGMVTGIAFSVSLFEALGGVTAPQPGQIATFMKAYHTVMLTAMAISLAAAIISLNRRSYAIPDQPGENSPRPREMPPLE